MVYYWVYHIAHHSHPTGWQVTSISKEDLSKVPTRSKAASTASQSFQDSLSFHEIPADQQPDSPVIYDVLGKLCSSNWPFHREFFGPPNSSELLPPPGYSQFMAYGHPHILLRSGVVLRTIPKLSKPLPSLQTTGNHGFCSTKYIDSTHRCWTEYVGEKPGNPRNPLVDRHVLSLKTMRFACYTRQCNPYSRCFQYSFPLNTCRAELLATVAANCRLPGHRSGSQGSNPL